MVLERHRAALAKPRYSLAEYRAAFVAAGLTRSAARLFPEAIRRKTAPAHRCAGGGPSSRGDSVRNGLASLPQTLIPNPGKALVHLTDSRADAVIDPSACKSFCRRCLQLGRPQDDVVGFGV
jgi:hypothetical protein